MKHCSRCRENKSLSDFHRCHRNKDGYLYVCKACIKLGLNKNRQKEYYLENKERIKKYQQKRKNLTAERVKMRRKKEPHVFEDIRLRSWYGISKIEKDEMAKNQGNRCKICKLETTLVVDHSHDTSKIRGLLCDLCNRGLGHFKDRIDLLESAISYLSAANE